VEEPSEDSRYKVKQGQMENPGIFFFFFYHYSMLTTFRDEPMEKEILPMQEREGMFAESVSLS
jgi:hypothetical protein